MPGRTPPDAPAQTRRHTRGRPPKGAGLLSLERITEAALEEIAEVGLEGMSARSVARRLNVDSKSLYNHVDGKDGLLTAVTDHVLSTISLPEPTGDLERDVRAFATAFRTHALRHPQAAILVMTRQTQSPASIASVESALTVLIAAGFEPARAVSLLRLLIAMFVGVVLRQAEGGLAFGADDVALAERQSILENAGSPVLAATAGHLVTIDHNAEFAFTLDRMVQVVLDEQSAIGR